MHKVSDATIKKIQELEQEHAQVYSELLRELDTLYLLEHEASTVTRDMEKVLETRRHLQMSLEKGATILRSIERLGDRNGSSEQVNSTEDILADRLATIMQENYEIDCKIEEFLIEENDITTALRRERDDYRQLSQRFKQLTKEIDEKPNGGLPGELGDSPEEQDDSQIVARQNEILEQLLIALKIHAGFDPYS